MPITQSRMLALLSAANDYATALRALISAINRTDQAYCALPTESQNWAAAFSEILPLAIESSLLERPIASASTIVVESEHFRRSAKSNIRSAARKRLQRHSAGIERRDTAPNSPVFGAPTLEHLEYAEQVSRPIREQSVEVRAASLSVREQQPVPESFASDDEMLEQFKASLSEDELRKFEETQRALEQRPASISPHFDIAPSAEGEDEFDASELSPSKEPGNG